MEEKQIDNILNEILTTALNEKNNTEPILNIAKEDIDFVNYILKSITAGSKGMFVVLHPNDRMQYLILNTNHIGALNLLALVMKQTTENIENQSS